MRDVGSKKNAKRREKNAYVSDSKRYNIAKKHCHSERAATSIQLNEFSVVCDSSIEQEPQRSSWLTICIRVKSFRRDDPYEPRVASLEL